MEVEAQFLIALLSVFVLLSLIGVLFGCVCGCRKTVPKPNNTLSSATRSLPDLPVETNRIQAGQAIETLWETTEHNGDTSSDLYATVEDNKSGRGENHKRELPRDSTIESSYESPSQTDNSMSPYARVKQEHPYDQVKQMDEHPYAQVRTNPKAGPSHAPDSSLHHSASSSSVDGAGSPVAPPRTRKSISLSQSSLSSSIDIPAATAIAGGIPANHELPYMTPPLPVNTQQQHFSGDSQDSSKGYTSISVREPLSNILGRVPRRQELIDSHYATVSDDSDEMYAAIEEPSQAVYTSGSETYAQIRPMAVVASVNPVRTENLQPPATHVLSVVKNHSRQESSSSAGSSNASPASPKPEKRQANSPLPRPPDPGHPALDAMYAKVMKKHRSSHSVSSTDFEAPEVTAVVPGYEIVQRPHSPHIPVVPGYETVAANCNNSEGMFCSGYETVEGEHDSLVPGYERVACGREGLAFDSEPNYEELRPQNGPDFTYATVNKKRKPQEPDYASLSRKDLGFERVEGFDPNYESVCQDPNYESVDRHDPPYEKVETNSDYVPVYNQERTEDMYSQVNKQRGLR